MEWLEDRPKLEASSSLEAESTKMEGYSPPEGWKRGIERLVNGRWVGGKRKRYEKGNWEKKTKEKIKTGKAAGWSSSRMEGRKMMKGRRRLEHGVKGESEWLENLMNKIMNDAYRQVMRNEGDKKKKVKRLERAAEVKENWERMYNQMDWLESKEEEEKKRRDRKVRASKRKHEWLEEHFVMDWLVTSLEEETFDMIVDTCTVEAVSSRKEENNMIEDKCELEAVSSPEAGAPDMIMDTSTVEAVSSPEEESNMVVDKYELEAVSSPEAGAPDRNNVKNRIELFESKTSKNIDRKIVKGKRRKPQKDNLIQMTISKFFTNITPVSTHTEGPVGGHTGRGGNNLTLPGSTEKKRKLSGGSMKGGGSRPPKIGKTENKGGN
jgi:hypothetical protein